ncbi:MAG: AAA family ATPase [Sulfurovum sp.]|nr:AAA family ATPase [Sulfurovum sp.]
MKENKQEHFIKNIKIKNFKCFKEFKAEGFGRVNLIGGKNNVGKTAFMEALELHIASTDVFALTFSLYRLVRRRQSSNRRDRYFELDFMYKDSSKMQLNVNTKKIVVEYYDELPDYIEDISDEQNLHLKYEPSLKLTVNNSEKVFSVNRIIDRPMITRRPPDDLRKEIQVNFISSTTTEEREIAILYGKLIDLNKEDFLDASLKLFDKNIIALKQKATERDVVLKLLLENQELPVLLSSLGEGINRYIAILSAIWASKDGFLFIDEIENGIHYSNYDKLWEIILKVSEDANCQLFISTHSKERIESYARVAKRLEDEEITMVMLARNPNNELKALVYDDKMFYSELEQDHEVRGW